MRACLLPVFPILFDRTVSNNRYFLHSNKFLGYGYTRSQRNYGSRNVTAHTSLHCTRGLRISRVRAHKLELSNYLYWRLSEYILKYEEQSRNVLLLKSCERRQIVQYSNRPTSRHEPIICSHSAAVNCNVTRWIKIPSFKKVCLNIPAKIVRDHLFDFLEYHFHIFTPRKIR